MSGRLMLLVATLTLAGCTAGTQPTVPGLSWPTSPEVLPPATGEPGAQQITCGSHTFAMAGLDAPTGAESAVGPEFDALRSALTKFGSSFPEAAGLTWRLAGRDDSWAIFLASQDDLPDPEWLSVEIANTAGNWESLGMGGCRLMAVLSPEFGPATWALDPAYPAPAVASTELNILVWERACSSGRSTSGRMSAPVVTYSSESLTITIGVRPLEGDLQTCPGPPGTPALVRLPEPLGDRELLDGAFVPPEPPTPAF